MVKKEGVNKKMIFAIVLFVAVVVVGTFIAIGAKRFPITGLATNTVTINITVGGPEVAVFNNTMTNVGSGLNSGPAVTNMTINFSVYIPAGVENLNYSSTTINFTRAGEATRVHSNCIRTESAGSYANVTCNVTMWWFDGAGAWNISASIKDNQTNFGQNITTRFTVGSTTGFQAASTLGWAGISPSATNQTSNTDPLILNNTGNAIIGVTSGNISINATNLRGETNNVLAIWVGNFSVGVITGAANPECGPNPVASNSLLNRSVFTNITGSNLTAGNYTINDGTTGQERLYFCISLAGSELTAQPYSTLNESSWTIQI